MRNMLRVKDLCVKYGNLQVLWDVSIDIDEGEIVSILGANGAGKSTLLKTIAGLLRPVSGKIIFMNRDISGLPAYEVVKKGLVLIPERRELFGDLTVYENLLMGGYILDKDEIEKRLKFIYKLFPILWERKKQLARTLSGGEQQMLAIARGVMSNPRLLMLDEPSLGLAPIVVSHLFKLIKRLNDEGVTILLVEQNVYKALEISNRSYVMENGRVVLSDSSKNLLFNRELLRKHYIT